MDRKVEDGNGRRLGFRILTLIGAFALVLGIAAAAMAASGGDPTEEPTVTATESPEVEDEDVSGPCDEAEHATDPACAGSVVSDDDADEVEDDAHEAEIADETDDADEVEDSDDQGEDSDDQGEDSDDQGEDGDADEVEDSHDQGEDDDDSGPSDDSGSREVDDDSGEGEDD